MGRASVRSAAVAYLQGANIPYVGTVYAGRPLVVDETDYDLNMSTGLFQNVVSPEGSSAVILVDIPESRRERRTMTGRTFEDDTQIHTVVLEVFMANVAGKGIAAQADNDATIDAIVDAIRADPLLGQPSVVWSAGEFTTGITVEQREPITSADGTVIFIPAVIRFETWEWLSSNA